MGASVARAHRATEGNEIASRFHDESVVESRGNSVSRRCLEAAVDASGVPRKVLAEEVGQKDAQFSKSLSGLPGGDFNGVLDNIRPSIRLDYAERLAAEECAGGLEELAAEELVHAAIRFLRTRRIPLKAAKAGLR